MAQAVLKSVDLRYTERPVDETPAVSTNPAATSQPSRIEEGCELVPVNETSSPTTTKARRVLAADSTGVALARMMRARGWRVDRKFKVARV